MQFLDNLAKYKRNGINEEDLDNDISDTNDEFINFNYKNEESNEYYSKILLDKQLLRLNNYHIQMKDLNREYMEDTTNSYYNYQNLARISELVKINKLNFKKLEYKKVTKVDEVDIKRGIKHQLNNKKDIEKVVEDYKIKRKAMTYPSNIKTKLKTLTIKKYTNLIGVNMGGINLK